MLLQMNACLNKCWAVAGVPNGMLIEVTRHFSDTAPLWRRLENEDTVRKSWTATPYILWRPGRSQ